MPSTMIFETDVRSDAHAKLAEVIGNGTAPLAECREDPNAAKPYQVWDGPDDSRPT